jgi:hypothetical protein
MGKKCKINGGRRANFELHYHHHHIHEGLGVFPVPFDPQDEVDLSISSSVVLCSSVLLVYT